MELSNHTQISLLIKLPSMVASTNHQHPIAFMKPDKLLMASGQRDSIVEYNLKSGEQKEHRGSIVQISHISCLGEQVLIADTRSERLGFMTLEERQSRITWIQFSGDCKLYYIIKSFSCPKSNLFVFHSPCEIVWTLKVKFGIDMQGNQIIKGTPFVLSSFLYATDILSVDFNRNLAYVDFEGYIGTISLTTKEIKRLGNEYTPCFSPIYNLMDSSKTTYMIGFHCAEKADILNLIVYNELFNGNRKMIIWMKLTVARGSSKNIKSGVVVKGVDGRPVVFLLFLDQRTLVRIDVCSRKATLIKGDSLGIGKFRDWVTLINGPIGTALLSDDLLGFYRLTCK